MEQYRGNTDTDAWYYAATELFRATGQYKYRNAIREYDAMEPGLKSRTVQNYTAMADFTYLSTTYGTDYARCAMLLDGYMDKAQSISVSSTRDNFYVLPDIAAMADGEIIAFMEVCADGENFLTESPDMLNICGAYCSEAWRGRGVSQMLLDHVLCTLQSEKVVYLGVDYDTMNPTAAGFWEKYFQPYTASLVRRIDK